MSSAGIHRHFLARAIIGVVIKNIFLKDALESDCHVVGTWQLGVEIPEHSRYQFSWYLVETVWEEAQCEVEKKKKKRKNTTSRKQKGKK